MAIKKYKPTTPGRRGMTVTDYSALSKVAPERSLLEPMKKAAGRNNTGRITVRHHGGGNRTKYRVIDFKRDKLDMPAVVKTLEYDPNRSAHIALVQYEDGEKRYILAPEGLKVGDTVMSGANADIKPGNCLPFVNIPVGTIVHNIELYPGKGAQLVRSAGNMAQLMAKEGKYALVRLPSGEMRNVPVNCIATIGQVGNIDHENVNIGKAGRKRHMGWRPTVRGSVMNPCDHPHGGGGGRLPRQVHGQDLIPPAAQGDEFRLCPPLLHLQPEHALFSQLVKATPLGAAGVSPESLPCPAQAAVLVDMAQGQVVQPAGGDVLLRDGAVVPLGGHLPVEDGQLDPLRRGMKAPQGGGALPGGAEGRSPHRTAQLRQPHRPQLRAGEQVDVPRPLQRGIGGLGTVPVVVARGQEYGAGDLSQGPGQGLDGLPEH